MEADAAHAVWLTLFCCYSPCLNKRIVGVRPWIEFVPLFRQTMLVKQWYVYAEK